MVKPNESAGTDLVFLCQSLEEALVAFTRIHGQFNGLGHLNDGALCQEFLEGVEYALDGVVRDGVYKVTAVWEYDKRDANGANFVYFGMRLRSGAGEKERELIAYSAEVSSSFAIPFLLIISSGRKRVGNHARSYPHGSDPDLEWSMPC